MLTLLRHLHIAFYLIENLQVRISSIAVHHIYSVLYPEYGHIPSFLVEQMALSWFYC